MLHQVQSVQRPSAFRQSGKATPFFPASSRRADRRAGVTSAQKPSVFGELSRSLSPSRMVTPEVPSSGTAVAFSASPMQLLNVDEEIITQRDTHQQFATTQPDTGLAFGGLIRSEWNDPPSLQEPPRQGPAVEMNHGQTVEANPANISPPPSQAADVDVTFNNILNFRDRAHAATPTLPTQPPLVADAVVVPPKAAEAVVVDTPPTVEELRRQVAAAQQEEEAMRKLMEHQEEVCQLLERQLAAAADKQACTKRAVASVALMQQEARGLAECGFKVQEGLSTAVEGPSYARVAGCRFNKQQAFIATMAPRPMASRPSFVDVMGLQLQLNLQRSHTDVMKAVLAVFGMMAAAGPVLPPMMW